MTQKVFPPLESENIFPLIQDHFPTLGNIFQSYIYIFQSYMYLNNNLCPAGMLLGPQTLSWSSIHPNKMQCWLHV